MGEYRGILKSNFSNKPRWIFSGLLLVAVSLGLWAWWISQHASVKIEWTTASELNTVGFNVYRRESMDGPETRINPELIPASTDPLQGGSYQFIDKAVEPGRTYYYELEDVEINGATNRSWHTSVSVAQQGFVEAGAAIALGVFALAGIISTHQNNRSHHD